MIPWFSIKRCFAIWLRCQFYMTNDCGQKWCLDMDWWIVYIPQSLCKSVNVQIPFPKWQLNMCVLQPDPQQHWVGDFCATGFIYQIVILRGCVTTVGRSFGFQLSWQINTMKWVQCCRGVAEPLCLCVDGSQLPSSRGCSLSQGGELPGSPVCTAGPDSELGRTRGKAFSLLWPRESKETYETTVTTELFWQCGDTAQPGPTPFPFPWVVVSIPVSQPWFSRLPQEVYPLLNGFCLKMFFLVPFCKWHNYKWYRRKWRDGKELLPADSPVTKVNSALMKLLRGSSGHEKLAISFFLNRHFNPNHIFLEIELKCFSILFFLGWLY